MTTCPKCSYESEDTKEWMVMFCPSWPDRCAGCEVRENYRKCPECWYEWDLVPDAA